MLNVSIIVLAVIFLGGLLYFERQGRGRAHLTTKTLLSCLFIAALLAQPLHIPGYYVLILVGLIFCLGGDVCLALPSDRAFMAGLVSFLLGHVCYIFAFAALTRFGNWISIGPPVIFIISGLIFVRLRPHLGKMTVPVLAYVIVISLMVSGAWAVLTRVPLPRTGKILLFAGAALFYLSDLFVARDRFMKQEYLNRLIGLPLYYGGQFLLAFSVGLLK